MKKVSLFILLSSLVACISNQKTPSVGIYTSQPINGVNYIMIVKDDYSAEVIKKINTSFSLDTKIKFLPDEKNLCAMTLDNIAITDCDFTAKTITYRYKNMPTVFFFKVDRIEVDGISLIDWSSFVDAENKRKVISVNDVDSKNSDTNKMRG